MKMVVAIPDELFESVEQFDAIPGTPNIAAWLEEMG